MDLSKAFDTVDKQILEHKLSALGICNNSRPLIDSYMGAEKCFLVVLRYKFVFSKKFRLRRAFSKCCTVDYALLLQLCMSLLREL